MIKKTTLKIISYLLIIILFGNFISPLSVFAQEADSPPSQPEQTATQPEQPSPPAEPENPPTAPSAPNGPSSAPDQPQGPTSSSSEEVQSSSSGSTGPSSSESPSYSPPPTWSPSGNSSSGSNNSNNNNSNWSDNQPDDEYYPDAPQATSSPFGPTPPQGSESSAFTPSGATGSFGSENYFGSTASPAVNETNSSSGNSNDPYNFATGPGSDNYGAEILNSEFEILNQNLAVLDNKISSIAKTGSNNANVNTLAGQIFTGDVVNTLNLMNKLNSNLSGIGSFNTMNLYGNYSGDIALNFTGGSPLSNFISASDTLASNSVTGPLSNNYSVTDGNFTVKDANGNDATLNNDIYLKADTGHNSASLNTGGGVIQTGDATALANIINLVNTNIQVEEWLFAVINIFGNLAGNIILPGGTDLASLVSGSNSTNVGNTTTGPDSTNNAQASSNNTTAISNLNTADINSNLAVSAKTGNNDANYNTGGGYVNSGAADSSVASTTVANTNTYDEDGTVFLVIVNEMGKWVGHIVGGIQGATNILLGNDSADSSEVTAQNGTTGPLSTNVSDINQNTDTILTNVNDASVTNNIKIAANSGSNDASKNTGPGIIETGDANAGLSLLNMANTNIVAKKLVVLFVNVIGNFIGDIIPSGQSQTTVGDNFTFGNGSFSQNSNLNSSPTPTGSSNQNVGGNEQALLTTQTGEQAASDAIYYYYYPEDYNWSEYNQYLNIASKKSGKYKQLLLSNEANLPEVSVDPSKLTRGTTFSTAFVKAVQSSGPATLVSGISLKVTYSWLLVLPLAIILYIYRRRNRIGIGIHRYINMLLDIIL